MAPFSQPFMAFGRKEVYSRTGEFYNIFGVSGDDSTSCDQISTCTDPAVLQKASQAVMLALAATGHMSI